MKVKGEKVFSRDIRIVGTVYVRAMTRREALGKFKGLVGDGIEVSGPLISGKQFDDPDLPEISLSPAMTLGNLVGSIEYCQNADQGEDEE